MDYLHFNAAKYIRFIKKAAQKSNKAKALSDDEVELLLAYAKTSNIRHYVALVFLFNLGLRVSELTSIKISDIDFHELTIAINGKGNKVRQLGLSDGIISVLRNYLRSRDLPLRPNDYLVQASNNSYNDSPVASFSISRIIKKYAKMAGICTKGLSTHSGRVTAINHLLDKDVPIRDVANFAGHSDINTTRHYDRKSLDKIIQTSKIISFS